ncbi:MAG: ligase-associated DNA damage response exonuclease [Luteibaculaceae bacterium]
MNRKPLLHVNENGIFCAQGNFYIDPWRKVDYAVITHAHADHSRWGMGKYLAHEHSVPIMRLRLGKDILVQPVKYSEKVIINGVEVSLHPAGHIIGSAQVRVSYKGEVWVVSGDYKPNPDLTCEPFEPVKCHVFISESTFGLPIYKWKPEKEIFGEINTWWHTNRKEGKTSIIYGYSLGKAQRILQGVNHAIGPVYVHGAVYNTNMAFREANLSLKPFLKIPGHQKGEFFKGSLVIAPPAAGGGPWIKKFGNTIEEAVASGWMTLRGAKRRRNIAHGFVLSDHADWEGLLACIEASEAEKVLLTHGYSSIVAQYLNENGIAADVLKTAYEGDAANEKEEVTEQE